MLCELLGLVQYTNMLWQNTGPPYEPELLRAVALRIRSLVQDFVHVVTTHRRIWRVSPTDITPMSRIHPPVKYQHTNQAAREYYAPVPHPLLRGPRSDTR